MFQVKMPAVRRKCRYQNAGGGILYYRHFHSHSNVECPHANLSLCITEADPLRSPFCHVPAEFTSKTVVYPEDNIFHSEFVFIPC